MILKTVSNVNLKQNWMGAYQIWTLTVWAEIEQK